MVALVAVAAVVVVALRPDPSRVSAALERLPASTERATWTDWARVRTALGSDVDTDSSGQEVEDFLDAGFDRDLNQATALASSAPVLQERYGFSPATLQWEALGQGRTGAVVLMRLPEGYDTAALRDRLDGLGYAEPDEDDGTWSISTDGLASLGTLSPDLGNLVVLDDEGLVVASDDPAYAASAADAARGEDVDGPAGDGDWAETRAAVAALGAPLVGVAYTADYACDALAMSRAEDDDEQTADDLVGAAGTVTPYRAMAVGVETDGEVLTTFGFEDGRRAEENADSRSRLASGPAPGQGGDFTDRFTLGRTTAEDGVVTLRMRPVDGALVFSDLSEGPVLYATC